MTQQKENTEIFKLPNNLIGLIDLSRLIRELETLDDFLYQTELREHGTPMNLPRSSKLLEEIASSNHYSLLDSNQRKGLIQALKTIEEHASVVHVSFAVDPSLNFMKKIVTWMRENIDNYIMVEVGLQPTISVGCVVRTNNKIFDMGLRHRFSESRDVLIKKIAETGNE